ncbi:hypothetical protein [Kineothrix sp. MB12-C1]|uniref:hypothetical protein n=1 Tax=Kineothrix sp. MB12-C1 TaxID=3070215 RepID=UPI0027D269E2|nr:hypothetical protein [Kineothrix sp. MB12-C1]WMC91640.1 hypothetical protein RBB56_12290 [Kineothrix sp. MB12-C1]
MRKALTVWQRQGNKYKRVTERIVFPLVLFLYPLLLINQGIDITDTTYSLGYYRFMDRMDVTWVLATYLANMKGSFLMKLPLGDTLLGMNFYTGIILSLLALICYYAAKRWMNGWIAFIGEMIALSLCWCPTTILYNYLTYFFFAAGSILLYEALIKEKAGYYLLAGLFLGLNVMVRFPNLVEASLIVALWYAGWLKKEKPVDTLKKTGLCFAGYFTGIAGVLLIIARNYGISSFIEMINGLFGMTEEASDYTLTGMLSDIAGAYLVSFRWIAYMIPCIFAGMIMFYIRKGQYERLKKILYCIGIVILFRFYLGQGMFSLRYYNEGSVFQWMMLFLILSIICCMVEISGYLSGDGDIQGRILAMIVLIIILVTPIGSNNYTYQNMNNLFLIAPYTLWMCYRIWRRTRWQSIHFPWQSFVAAIILMLAIQGIGFGNRYVFRDGIYGEKRNAQVTNSSILRGMYTTEENAESLTELIAFWEEERLGEEPVIFWGDAPGLSYILDVPSAIFTTWPEIPSNTYSALSQALEELNTLPPVILHNERGKEIVAGEKTDLILDFLSVHHYLRVFENENYQIYKAVE